MDGRDLHGSHGNRIICIGVALYHIKVYAFQYCSRLWQTSDGPCIATLV